MSDVQTTFADQLHLHDPAAGIVGDCWRASIASIIGLPAADVPHFVADYPDETVSTWFTQTQLWLTSHYGVTILYYDNPEAVRADRRAEASAYPHILIDGISPRFADLHHVVVGDNETGAIVHDPHPSRAGLTTVTGAFVLVDLWEAGA